MNNTMLSDRIEKFILEMLDKETNDQVLLKRKDVADLLECAPSQVTYVINTRFSSDDRFVVESRRGSGGYIKISLRSQNHRLGGHRLHRPLHLHQTARKKAAERAAPKKIQTA